MSFIVSLPGWPVQASEAPCISADAFDGLSAMAARRAADQSAEDHRQPPSQEEEARYICISHVKPEDIEMFILSDVTTGTC